MRTLPSMLPAVSVVRWALIVLKPSDLKEEMGSWRSSNPKAVFPSPAKEVNASSLEIYSSASTDVHESASARTCSAVLPSSILSRVIGTTSSGPLTTLNLIMEE